MIRLARNLCVKSYRINKVNGNQILSTRGRLLRQFSATPSSNDPTTDFVSDFGGEESVTDILTSGIESIEVAATALVPELGSYPTHLVMKYIDYIHVAGGVPYWEAIVVSIIGIRFFLLPFAIRSQRAVSGLAIIRPLMERLTADFQANPNKEEKSVQQLYQANIKLLFQKHKVNPIAPLTMPVLQLPIFVSYFLGLQAMATFFPDLVTGGAMWFTDLTVADTTRMLPVLNALSFLAIVEIASDQSAGEHKEKMKWGMRALSLVIAPMTMGYSQAVFVFWITNNVFSIFQGLFLKIKSVRNYFGIADIPKVGPDLKVAGNPFKAMMKAYEEYNDKRLNAKAEIIDGKKAPSTAPPPPPSPIDQAKLFTHNPQKKKKLNK